MSNTTVAPGDLAVLRTITEALGAAAGEPFYYSDFALRLDQQQRESVRQGFMSLVNAGVIELGVQVSKVSHKDPANNREYRFADGARALRRYRLHAEGAA